MELLERATHLDELRRLLRDAGEGRGRLALLGGEAGVGKTALVRRFGEGARAAARVLVGTCDALSTPRALGPLFDVAGADAELDRLLTENAPRDQLSRAVLAVLDDGHAAIGRPTVLVIEDAHWADEATLDLLRYLGRRIDATRGLVVVTYRDDEIGPRHPLLQVLGDLATVEAVCRLRLRPLTAEAVATLAADSGVDPAALHARTGGNPFFVTEVLAAGGAIPPTVQEAVLARVARLAPAVRGVLETAAVIGSPIDPELLIRVAAADLDELDACLESGMLQAEGRALAFRHELAREAVLASISPARLMAQHRQVLQDLAALPARDSDPARLAHHAEEAGDQEAVLVFAPEAARRAAALRAHREAAAQYARVLRFGGGLPPAERAAVLEARSYECYLTGQIDEAISARQSALEVWLQLGDTARAGENRSRLVILYWAASQIEAAEREASAAVDALEKLPPGPELALAYGAYSRICLTIRDLSGAIAWGERAMALAERVGVQSRFVGPLITVGLARHGEGDERGREQLERALRLALAGGEGIDTLIPRACYCLGLGYLQQYGFAQADRHFEAGIAHAEKLDLDHARLFATAWLAYSRYCQGHWDEAGDLAAAVLRAANVPPITRFAALAVLGGVRVRRGEPDAAPYLDEALALALGSGSLARIGPIRAARAEAAWLAGDRDRARAEARVDFDLAIARSQRWYTGELAYWRWKTDDLDRPPPAIAEPFALQIAGDWAGAAAAWDELGCPYEAARARAEGDDAAALRQALETFERLDARPAAALVRRRLQERGVRGVPRGPRPSTRANPANLTRREVEIVALLAEGRSNHEIAARLGRSPRTVENHVAAILAKLGVAGRAEVAREAARLGLDGNGFLDTADL